MQYRWLVLLGFFGATLATAALGSAAIASRGGTWYQTLQKPEWNPPAWIFGPVWSVLYLLMAVAAWRVWRHHENPDSHRALAWFFSQLFLSALCSFLFFGLKNPGLALLGICLLLTCLVVVQVRFWRIDRPAGVLWAPYVCWVAFVTVLNTSIWWLNR